VISNFVQQFLGINFVYSKIRKLNFLKFPEEVSEIKQAQISKSKVKIMFNLLSDILVIIHHEFHLANKQPSILPATFVIFTVINSLKKQRFYKK
jgi:hypothetical protein